jgi:hypothetical protein
MTKDRNFISKSPQVELFPTISESEKETAEEQLKQEQVFVDYEIREYTIELLIDKYSKGLKDDTNDIFIPKYQRKYVWSSLQASEFIESLLLGLPIPYMFTADNNGRSEVVDGSQRIRTLYYFLNNQFPLLGLTKLTAFENFFFSDFLDSRQKRFKKKTVRLIELTDKAEYDTRKEIFRRINTSSTVLEEIEIRQGSYEGDFMDFINTCANNSKFKQLCPTGYKKELRGESRELVLRFFALAEQYQNFVHIVKDFLNEFVINKNKLGFNDIELQTNFEDMLDFVEKHFKYGFRKNQRAKATSRVRFEAIAVGVHLAILNNPNLQPIIPVESWIDSTDFTKFVTSGSANNKNKVIGRIEFVYNKLTGKTLNS